MIDLSKAFDSINHNLLLKKLHAYGVQGVELAWFSNYLTERKQRVVMNGVPSQWAEISTGVPQGSILGPLLFVIFVNDLPSVVEECTVNLYADDTALYSVHSDPGELSRRVQEDLQRVAEWITRNGLRMNVNKTQLLVLNRKGKQSTADSVQVSVGDSKLQKQDCVKYLGVSIDKDLSWKTHIEQIRAQCMAKLAAIRRAGSYLPCHVRKLLYQSFVLPHLDYCSVVWNSCGTTLSDRVERVQNYALRIILRKPPRTSSEALRQTLCWTTLKRRRHNATVCQVHRCVNKQGPSYLNSKFVTNSTLNYACTRGFNKLHLKRPNTNFYRTTFEYMGAQLFNSLPEEIRAVKSYTSFKRALQTIYH